MSTLTKKSTLSTTQKRERAVSYYAVTKQFISGEFDAKQMVKDVADLKQRLTNQLKTLETLAVSLDV